MPLSDHEVARIAAEAERLMAQTAEDLEYSFRLSWARSQVTTSLPRRGGDDFWRNTQKRLAREIVQNSATGPVTMGMIAAYVLNWAEGTGIDLVHFEAPMIIYVALVAKSVLDHQAQVYGGATKPGEDSRNIRRTRND
jgi:hypothetical protein